jgi:hypothetical protein
MCLTRRLELWKINIGSTTDPSHSRNVVVYSGLDDGVKRSGVNLVSIPFVAMSVYTIER